MLQPGTHGGPISESSALPMTGAVREYPATMPRDYLLETMTFLAKFLRHSLQDLFPDNRFTKVFAARVIPSELDVIPLSAQGMKYQDIYPGIISCWLHDSQVPGKDREFHVVEGPSGIIVFKIFRVGLNEFLAGYEMERRPAIAVMD